jgi:hypothetical protein
MDTNVSRVNLLVAKVQEIAECAKSFTRIEKIDPEMANTFFNMRDEALLLIKSLNEDVEIDTSRIYKRLSNLFANKISMMIGDIQDKQLPDEFDTQSMYISQMLNGICSDRVQFFEAYILLLLTRWDKPITFKAWGPNEEGIRPRIDMPLIYDCYHYCFEDDEIYNSIHPKIADIIVLITAIAMKSFDNRSYSVPLVSFAEEVISCYRDSMYSNKEVLSLLERSFMDVVGDIVKEISPSSSDIINDMIIEANKLRTTNSGETLAALNFLSNAVEKIKDEEIRKTIVEEVNDLDKVKKTAAQHKEEIIDAILRSNATAGQSDATRRVIDNLFDNILGGDIDAGGLVQLVLNGLVKEDEREKWSEFIENTRSAIVENFVGDDPVKRGAYSIAYYYNEIRPIVEPRANISDINLIMNLDVEKQQQLFWYIKQLVGSEETPDNLPDNDITEVFDFATVDN